MATLDSTPSASQSTERRTPFSQSCKPLGSASIPVRAAASRAHGAVPPDGSRARAGDHAGGDDPGPTVAIAHGAPGVWPGRTCRLPGVSQDGNAEDRQKGRDRAPHARRGKQRQEAESAGQGPADCPHGVPATCQPKLLADVFVALAQQADQQGELHSADKGRGQDYDRRDHGPAPHFAQEMRGVGRTKPGCQNRQAIAQGKGNRDAARLQDARQGQSVERERPRGGRTWHRPPRPARCPPMPPRVSTRT